VKVEQRLQELGLALPAPQRLPGGPLPFVPVRLRGNRAFIAGHGPLNDDGSVWGVRGKVGADVTLEQGQEAAKRVALAILADLQRALGDLDRVTAWLKVLGMVNSAPGFTNQPAVINGFSDLILGLYGEDAGAHARSAVGMAELPFSIPVEIEAEVEIAE
jgi:enamine deaminase RidA (YjgF/YER057c/UK114 family)